MNVSALDFSLFDCLVLNELPPSIEVYFEVDWVLFEPDRILGSLPRTVALRAIRNFSFNIMYSHGFTALFA